MWAHRTGGVSSEIIFISHPPPPSVFRGEAVLALGESSFGACHFLAHSQVSEILGLSPTTNTVSIRKLEG